MTKEALKLALEALEEAWYHVGTFQPTEKAIDLYDEARTAIKEALAQPEQEPVAWRAPNWGHSADEWVYRDFDDPVLIADGKPSPNNEPLYTTPPQRKPLTDEEIVLIVAECASSAHRHDDFSFARAIEAAHGIKGET